MFRGPGGHGLKTRLQSILERAVGYGLIAGALVVFSFFYTNINRTQKTAIDQMHGKLDELKLALIRTQGDLEDRKGKIERINQQLEARQKEVRERFERLLDKKENYTRFIEQVQRKAAALDIDIVSSTYDQPSPVQGAPAAYLEFKFTMAVKGTYDRMKQFLWEMENALGRFVKIGKMGVGTPICDKKGNMSLSLMLSTYFKP